MSKGAPLFCLSDDSDHDIYYFNHYDHIIMMCHYYVFSTNNDIMCFPPRIGVVSLPYTWGLHILSLRIGNL